MKLPVAVWVAAGALQAAMILQWSDVQKLPPEQPGRKIAYGTLADQFGVLRVPAGAGPHPVVVLIHGGCWREIINMDHSAHLAAALTKDGYATWSIEYRRADAVGGGWPGTFDDVLAGFDQMGKIAVLDRSRTVLMGHSAGGHLALWAAAKRKGQVRGVVSLSGVTDLRGGAASVCTGMIPKLVGGEENYAKTSPIEMLPLGVPQWIFTAPMDDIVPPKWAEAYTAAARKAGDRVKLVNVPDAGHFEQIVPGTAAYEQVRAAVREAMGPR